MVQDIVIEPVGDGPCVRIFVDGDNIAHITRKAKFVFEAGQSGVNWCINTMHDSAPTIIEAEEGE